MQPCLPCYGGAALADVGVSLLASIGVPSMTNVLCLPQARKACLLLIDGMGWELLRHYAEHAPFLASLTTEGPITAGFPTTTATSLTSLGTSLPPGMHGIVGYTFILDDGELFSPLAWRQYGTSEAADLDPTKFQPYRTVFERAADAGVTVRQIAPHDLNGSGLTRAAFRGAAFVGVHALGDLTSGILDALRTDAATFCYAYHPHLDLLGHIYGPGSEPWCQQLGFIDRMVETIAEGLPTAATLVVTADHGMVRVDDMIDYDETGQLRHGVRLLGGEPRMRHVYTKAGVEQDVADAWRALLGTRAWVLTCDEAIAHGWFGNVDDRIRPRIGDVLVAARGTTAVVRPGAERLSTLPGQHGSLTTAEQLIPLLLARG